MPYSLHTIYDAQSLFAFSSSSFWPYLSGFLVKEKQNNQTKKPTHGIETRFSSLFPGISITAPQNITKIRLYGIPGKKEGHYGPKFTSSERIASFHQVCMVCSNQLGPYFIGIQHETIFCFPKQFFFFHVKCNDSCSALLQVSPHSPDTHYMERYIKSCFDTLSSLSQELCR